MTESQQRAVMVALAVAGVLHEVYTRERVASTITRRSAARASAYYAAAERYRRAAEWFGRRALRAEANYYAEISS
jgi:hypothetical protein